MHIDSLDSIIHENEFLALLEKNMQSVFEIFNFMKTRDDSVLPRKFFAKLEEETNELESFLDDYDARNNKTYSYFAEIIASIRGFATACYILKHVLVRYPKYNLQDGDKERIKILAQALETLSFCVVSVKDLFAEVAKETQNNLGLPVPQDVKSEEAFLDKLTRRKTLPHNVDEGNVTEERQRIAEVATKYLQAVRLFPKKPRKMLEEYEELKAYVEENLDEERARQLETVIHVIQSKYDTYIKGTNFESKYVQLTSLRGHVSMVLHLLEIVTQLVHFYERHENDIRFEKTKKQIAQIVDKQLLLSKVVNFGYKNASYYMMKGKPIAEEIIAEFTSFKEVEFDIPENVVMHARPASLIVHIVNHHGTPVEMEFGEQKADASSIMQVMMVLGYNSGCKKIFFRGDERPLNDLIMLFENDLGEKGLENLPPKLDYLKKDLLEGERRIM